MLSLRYLVFVVENLEKNVYFECHICKTIWNKLLISQTSVWIFLEYFKMLQNLRL